MRRIKLFENFNKVELESLTKSIDDILVELGDIGLEWFISQHKNVIGVEIYKEPVEQDDDEDFDWGYDAGREETNLFNFEDIFEPVMTLLSFMRDKYPDMTIEPLITVNNLPETDDWFEEFLEENDLESVTLDEVKQFTNISSFDIEFTI
jgi:hypothetical protein